MKTILIATDFSNASRNACLYGLQLAKSINADTFLFNAYKIPLPATGLNVGVSGYDIMVQTRDKLEEEAIRLLVLNNINKFYYYSIGWKSFFQRCIFICAKFA